MRVVRVVGAEVELLTAANAGTRALELPARDEPRDAPTLGLYLLLQDLGICMHRKINYASRKQQLANKIISFATSRESCRAVVVIPRQ
jgi:hypothetical protein